MYCESASGFFVVFFPRENSVTSFGEVSGSGANVDELYVTMNGTRSVSCWYYHFAGLFTVFIVLRLPAAVRGK